MGTEGKSILALPSRTRRGVSRIVPYIAEGAGERLVYTLKPF
jgi:acyl-CoA hydrolase